MIGAIIGDIVGSRFEFDRGGHTKDFKLFTHECNFTDDTVMTVAIADALLHAGPAAELDEIRRCVIYSMRKWGRKYPYAGYGGGFRRWLTEENPQPYNSYGNGSAMRVSPVGWLYNWDIAGSVAEATADVTHNHPEGIKGAQCTAQVIALLHKDIHVDDLMYVINQYGYKLGATLDELRERHEHVESCQDSLPKALTAFLDGNDFEDVIRNAVSLGGDTDTIAAIAGSMAEAAYGVPDKLVKEAMHYLPKDICDVIARFYATVTYRNKTKSSSLIKNTDWRERVRTD